MRKIGVWLDDYRDPFGSSSHTHALEESEADEIIWVLDVDAFRKVVLEVLEERGGKGRELCGLFFDNDLGDLPGREGHNAFNWFEELCHERDVPPVFLYCQSSNSSAKQGMEQGFASLRAYWESSR